MVPQPKRKHSSHRQGKRRAGIRLTLPSLVICKKCNQPTLPHQECSSCGFYASSSSPK